MPNAYINKVQLSDGTTLIDLTSDTITAGDAVVGVTLHLASGEAVTGTLADFTGATSGAAGTHGLVPAPASGEQNKLLFGDGAWSGLTSSLDTLGSERLVLKIKHGSTAIVSQDFSTASTMKQGLMSAADKSKLDGIGKTVLWVNGMPDSSFAAQTITMVSSAANFDFLLFEYYYSTTGQQLQTQLVGADFSGTIALRIVQAGQNRTGGRNCTVNGTSVTFEAAQFNAGTSNTNCIPYRIIGIKL